MKVAMHQPMFLPYLGFFDKLRQVDKFVILDDVQFSKNSFQNRNRIKTVNGIKWLTVPVQRNSSKLLINEMRIANDSWALSHLGSITAEYRKAPYYSNFIFLFEKVFKIPTSYLAELNILLLEICMQILGIETDIILSSSLDIKTTSTQRLVDICKKLGATEYLAGQGGNAYMDISLFEKAGIKVIYQDFKHPVYKQQYGAFVSNLSILDYLMNVGSEPFWENEE